MPTIYEPAVTQLLARCNNEPTGGCGQAIPGTCAGELHDHAISAMICSMDQPFLVWLIREGALRNNPAGIDAINNLRSLGYDRATFREIRAYDPATYIEDWRAAGGAAGLTDGTEMLLDAFITWVELGKPKIDTWDAVNEILMDDLRKQLEEMMQILGTSYRKDQDTVKLVGLVTTPLARRACKLDSTLMAELHAWAFKMQAQHDGITGNPRV